MVYAIKSLIRLLFTYIRILLVLMVRLFHRLHQLLVRLGSLTKKQRIFIRVVHLITSASIIIRLTQLQLIFGTPLAGLNLWNLLLISCQLLLLYYVWLM